MDHTVAGTPPRHGPAFSGWAAAVAFASLIGVALAWPLAVVEQLRTVDAARQELSMLLGPVDTPSAVPGVVVAEEQ